MCVQTEMEVSGNKFQLCACDTSSHWLLATAERVYTETILGFQGQINPPTISTNATQYQIRKGSNQNHGININIKYAMITCKTHLPVYIRATLGINAIYTCKKKPKNKIPITMAKLTTLGLHHL